MIKKDKLPLISVVMPVWNAGSFLVPAIESILNQTYQSFEFIIVDDASTDGSCQTLQKYARSDKRITLLRNDHNCGVSITVKKAISYAKGKYLARMDADDVSHLDRLEKQLLFLKSHPQVVAVGGQCRVINAEGVVIGHKQFPLTFEEIYRYIFTLIPIQQPSVMISRSRLPKDFVYYVDGMNTAEEVELIFKLFRHGQVVNMPDTLLDYRWHRGNLSLKSVRTTFFLTLLSRIKAVVVYGYRPTLSGIATTIAETIAVILLPKPLVVWLYRRSRKIVDSPSHVPALAEGVVSPAV